MAYIKDWALEGCINAAIAYRDAADGGKFDGELYSEYMEDCRNELDGDHYGVCESQIVQDVCFSAIVELGLEPSNVVSILKGYGFSVVGDPMHGMAEDNGEDGCFDVTDYECDERGYAKGICPVCGAVLVGKVSDGVRGNIIVWGGRKYECCECHSELSFSHPVGDM